MTLKELCDEAKAKSAEFKEKLEWYTHTRKKLPTLEWLMPKLERALGRDYVRQAAEAQAKEATRD